MTMPSQTLIVVICLLSAALVLELFGSVECRPVGNPLEKGQGFQAVTPLTAGNIRPLVGTIWDLSFCGGGLKLRLGGKMINRPLFIFTTIDAARFAPIMYGEKIQDRVYVWCRTALLFSSLARDQAKDFDVEQINKFQGDMILSRQTVDFVLAPYFPTDTLRSAAYAAAARSYQRDGATSVRRVKRKILPWEIFYWNNARIRYKINDKELNGEDRRVIREAMNHWEENTCIRFTQTKRIFFQPHLNFRKKDGCWSFIGQQSVGQEISIGRGCAFMAIVAHEIGHAIGFYHEQSRPDRDRYISLNKANIVPRMEANFAKTEWSVAKTDGIPYDYSSVMHYKSTDFSPSGKGVALVAKDPEMQKVMGQREALSFLDVKLANVNYCSGVCGTKDLEWDECEHGGYRNPNDCKSCVCPRGLAPPKCEGPTNGANADCGEQVLTATDEPKALFSPRYHDLGMPSSAVCSWLIKSPSPDKRIKFEFRGNFNFTEDPVLCEDYVEVRYKNMGMTGARFCGRDIPTKAFISHSHEMLIVVHTLKVDYWQGFQAQYIEEKCGGCSVDASGNEPLCLRTTKYDCAEDYKTTCHGAACVQQRKNYCFREEEFCCDGFVATGPRCMRAGSRLPAGLPNPVVPNEITTTPKPTTTTTIVPTTTTTTTPAPTTTTTTPKPTATTTTTPAPTTTTTSKPTTTTTTTPRPTTTTTTTTTPSLTTTTTTTPMPTTTTTTPRPTTTTTTTPMPTTTTKTPRPTTTTTTTTTSMPTTKTTTTTTPKPITTTPTPTTTTKTTAASVILPPVTRTILRPSFRFSTASPSIAGVWGPWGEWSSCSATCGLCGKQTRRRTCSNENCLGLAEEWVDCGDPVCPFRTIQESSMCTRRKRNCKGRTKGWWLSRTDDCIETYTCFKTVTTSRCCVGFVVHDQCRK